MLTTYKLVPVHYLSRLQPFYKYRRHVEMHTTMSLHGYLRSTRGIKRHTYSVANGTCFRVTYKKQKQNKGNEISIRK